MPNLFFFRDNNNISELKAKTNEAIKNKITPISCNIVSSLVLEDKDFLYFCNNLKKNQPFLYKYIDLMDVDEKGWWNCILITDKNKNETIVVYNNGFSYPRFTALML